MDESINTDLMKIQVLDESGWSVAAEDGFMRSA